MLSVQGKSKNSALETLPGACSHHFVLAALQALSFNQPGENEQCSAALGVSGGHL